MKGGRLIFQGDRSREPLEVPLLTHLGALREESVCVESANRRIEAKLPSNQKGREANPFVDFKTFPEVQTQLTRC